MSSDAMPLNDAAVEYGKLSSPQRLRRERDERVKGLVERLVGPRDATVTLAEILSAIQSGADAPLPGVRRERYAKEAVRASCDGLVSRGELASPGFRGSERVYGLTRAANDSGVTSRVSYPTREEVVAHVRQVALNLGRPVCFGDIRDPSYELVQRIGEKRLQEQVRRAVSAKQLEIVHKQHGRRSGGLYHYLPPDLVATLGTAGVLDSITETVAKTVSRLWRAQCAQAAEIGEAPAPLLLGAITRAVAATVSPGAHCSGQDVLASLRALERLKLPVVRSLRVGKPPVVGWIPASVPTADVSKKEYHSSDCQRARECVRLAILATGHYAVSASEVQQAQQRAPELAMCREDTIFRVLGTAARTELARDGARVWRRTPYVVALGAVEDVAYYTLPDAAHTASAEMQLRRILETATIEDVERELRSVGNAMSAVMREVRASDVRQRLDERSRALARLVAGDQLPEDLASMARASALDATLLVSEVDIRFAGIAVVAGRASSTYAAASLDELLASIRPLIAQRLGSDARPSAGQLFSRPVRWMQAPSEGNERADLSYSPRTKWYDRAGAEMELAIRFGGLECRLRASLAQRELGLCRSAASVCAALQQPNLTASQIVRLQSSLAFLRGDMAVAALLELAASTKTPEVRVAAYWALGFIGGSEGEFHCLRVLGSETEPRAREQMAGMSEIAAKSEVGWWAT